MIHETELQVAITGHLH